MFFLSPYYFQTPAKQAKEAMALGKQNLRANWNSYFFQVLAFMFLNTADCRETCVLSVLLTPLNCV